MSSSRIVCPSCGTTNRVPDATPGKPRCPGCRTILPWLTDADTASFEDIVERSTLPVLVDLWAPWCGPCRMVAPALVELSTERAGALRIVKVNVDDEPAIPARLRVQGIPTMVLFQAGVEVGRHVGALPLPRMRAWLDATLESAPTPRRR